MTARSVHVSGVVQGVGFRPFVFRLAHTHSLAGWVLNEESGVDIRLEGATHAIETFLRDLVEEPPAAARIANVQVRACEAAGLQEFTIRETRGARRPITRISPDLPVCEDCLAEMRDRENPRFGYPYINCVNCGPRYTVVENLPYDRSATTMRHWTMDALCEAEYSDPTDRRFHAQPIACPVCGPSYHLHGVRGPDAIARAAALLREGCIVAIKGIGGYHLACDARNDNAVRELRERKFRKEKPFAVMAANIEVARFLVRLSAESEALLNSSARPIVLAPAIAPLPHVAPAHQELGVMLPYAPLHHLLFDAGAPEVLVLTSGNRSSEPIAYRDEEACERLAGLADAVLTGERPIARRVDDSVARVGAFGPMILRRSRGYAPGAVTALPAAHPILAAGADLKSAIALVVGGQAFISQHIGDLDHYEAFKAFDETIRDLTRMYRLDVDKLTVAHDLHPQYLSTRHAQELGAANRVAVQHHRAHIASVLAERQAWDKRVIGVSFDGTGYGDDGAIWGGEFFHGSVAGGFDRVLHLRTALLPGGDAAARHPPQSAAGFLHDLPCAPDLGERFQRSREMIRKGVRIFSTTSVGRLFDAAAALLGFNREITFEGQAAIWLEELARGGIGHTAYTFPRSNSELDYRPLLEAVIVECARGRDPREIALAFHRTIARAIHEVSMELCAAHATDTVVLSGGVFQNSLLLHQIKSLFEGAPISIWTNSAVPPNDGGICLGQAAIAAFAAKGQPDA